MSASTEDGRCGHTPLFAQDPVRWVERVTPCLYCKVERMRAALDEAEAVIRGEHGSDWADHFGPLFNLIEATKP